MDDLSGGSVGRPGDAPDVSNPLLDDDDELGGLPADPVGFGRSRRGPVPEPPEEEEGLPGLGDWSPPSPEVREFERLHPDGHGDWEESAHRAAASPSSAEDELGSLLDSLDGLQGGWDGGTGDPVTPLAPAAPVSDEARMDAILLGVEAAMEAGPPSLEDEDEDELAGFSLDACLGQAIEMGASDVHLSADDEVAFTILGDIRRIPDFGLLNANQVARSYATVTSHVAQDDFAKDLELDTSYVVRTGRHRGRRLRLSVGRSLGNVFMTFRVIADVIPTPAELGVSGPMLDWCRLPNGLVMVNGPTGTGKTTTLASLVQEIQMTRPVKIITIERPVEFVYGVRGRALITQREVGSSDTRTFAGALTSAMRQAPNIIMVGEVRNQTEVNELLRAAETGHLAISTMHTNSAPATINRIKGLYEGDDQIRILGALSEVARGFANQVLVKTPDGSGRLAVREVLEVDEAISGMILRGDVESIKAFQMGEGITMEHELVRAVLADRVTREEARRATSNMVRFDHILESMAG